MSEMDEAHLALKTDPDSRADSNPGPLVHKSRVLTAGLRWTTPAALCIFFTRVDFITIIFTVEMYLKYPQVIIAHSLKISLSINQSQTLIYNKDFLNVSFLFYNLIKLKFSLSKLISLLTQTICQILSLRAFQFYPYFYSLRSIPMQQQSYGYGAKIVIICLILANLGRAKTLTQF